MAHEPQSEELSRRTNPIQTKEEQQEEQVYLQLKHKVERISKDEEELDRQVQGQKKNISNVVFDRTKKKEEKPVKEIKNVTKQNNFFDAWNGREQFDQAQEIFLAEKETFDIIA
jgi:hypothetical protein